MDENSEINEEVGVETDAEPDPEIVRLVREIKAVRDELEELTELEETLRLELIDVFKQKDTDYYEGSGVAVDFYPAKTENRLDTKRLREEDPDLYQKYVHAVERREHLRFRKID
ncbi:hypothetical protein MsAg5_10030 [Methanosarcinaceae archaeon Ag5]|uniref:Uncharacterized protein n=1 Tax=Methanolapillus africanus TaxID=3028297 RepID=A0AAE4SDU6_9EURY|nr:hypothetical protein [Methanosarcinaceae archaeon Ag5]